MTLSVEAYQRAARRYLPRVVYDYVDGAADAENCLARNRRDLDAVTLAPRVLRDTRPLALQTAVYGKTWRQPFALAPTGLNGLLRPNGDALLAAAAAEAGVPFVLSTASNTRLEDVRRAAPAAELWLQLYVMQDRSIAEQLIARARAAAFETLVLTVDVPVSGLRRRDQRNGFKLPLRPTPKLIADLVCHPLWAWQQLRHGPPEFANLVADPTAELSAQAQAALLARSMDRSLDWNSLRWLRAQWPGPLLLKGLLHPADVALALDHGVDGLIVSNHGGRQFDAAPSAIKALPGIVAAANTRIPVFMDSGLRSGTDIVRALALGAHAVFIGRPALYGLAARGEAGVADVLALLSSELERCMTLLGARDTAELRDCLLTSLPSV